jgi:phosphoglycolate phosphatase
MKLIIFDLDGTLLDTLDDLWHSVNFALTQHYLPTRTREQVRSFVGNGIRVLIQKAVPEDCDPSVVDSVFTTFQNHYMHHSMDNTRMYDGIEHLLEELKRRNYNIAIASNKIDAAVQDLSDRFFKSYVTYAVGEGNGLNRKPSPDLLLACIKQTECRLDEVIYVGDSEVDIETAHNAQIPVVSVTWGFRDKDTLRELHPDYIINTPLELLPILSEQ